MIKPDQISFNANSSAKRCLEYRKRILDISQKVSALHAAPAFSCVELTDVIYNGLMRIGLGEDAFHDIFLMSKGHGCMTQYAVLEKIGVLSTDELEMYCTPEGILGAHPDRGNPGIVASTGSLGHGMGLAVGMAHAESILNQDRNIYLILSDGELQEGSSWEAAMMAANLKLKNLIALVDFNDFGGLERMSEGHQAFQPLKAKFEAFGWEAVEVNGHNASAIHAAVSSRSATKPFVLIGHTVKGKGVSYMENVPIWHYRSPNKQEYLQAVGELKEILS